MLLQEVPRAVGPFSAEFPPCSYRWDHHAARPPEGPMRGVSETPQTCRNKKMEPLAPSPRVARQGQVMTLRPLGSHSGLCLEGSLYLFTILLPVS